MVTSIFVPPLSLFVVYQECTCGLRYVLLCWCSVGSIVMPLGDTDSVFVQLPGRNRKQAFEIGKVTDCSALLIPQTVDLTGNC